MSETGAGRDRLRELLDAVLDEEHRSLEDMARGAHSSPYHFSRQLSRGAGEPPVAMRRRVMLERAAWQLRRGATVTDTAFAAGYESVEGFARAFARAYGHPPSAARPDGDGRTGHWLPAPNGIHFHPPTSLWVHAQEQTVNPFVDHLVRHDLDDTAYLVDLAKQLGDDDFRAVRRPGTLVTEWDGAEESVAAVLEHHVWTKEVWLAAVEGADLPDRGGDDPAALTARHFDVAPRWLAAVRDVERRGAWDDRIVDALCDPPESFPLGGILAHVLTYAAHRRQLVRQLLREAGLAVDQGDPLMWLRREAGGER
ncbi:helix-turn-helix domain-containing protein [Nocardioides dongkuii]|uniref:helix-turn-helix domain-containing protein n=1 Tax=Nocardioides dongkuii TaxID=2760089 RepID=UPI001FD4B767|nr:helix-turn-helix domain-containing protein [Nocardioides dongkuii]